MAVHGSSLVLIQTGYREGLSYGSAPPLFLLDIKQMKITPKEDYAGFLGGDWTELVKGESTEVSDAAAKVAAQIGLCDAPKKTTKKKNASS